MGSGLKFLFPRTLFLAFVVLIIGEGILVLVCVALKWHSIDTFNFQNNLNFPRLFTSQKYWLHFIMSRMSWRTWGAEIIEWFTVLLQQPWEVLFWLWGYVKPQNSNHCFFLRKSLNIQACCWREVAHQLDVWTCPPTNCWLGIICKHNRNKSSHKWSLSVMSFQDEKNQILTTNVWLSHVSRIMWYKSVHTCENPKNLSGMGRCKFGLERQWIWWCDQYQVQRGVREGFVMHKIKIWIYTFET